MIRDLAHITSHGNKATMTRHYICILVVLCISLQLQNSDAFHIIRQCCHFSPPCTRTHLQENDFMDSRPDNIDRRAFIRGTSSIIFFSLITPKELAFADEDVDADSPAVATPSISEGDLVLSEPPPNRVKKVVPSVEEEGNKKRADPRFFIAGGASAAISHGITTPIDVVKTKMQSDSTLTNISPSEAALKIIEREGTQSLSSGLGPTVIGYGIEGALKFGVYESLKPVFLSVFPVHNEAYLAAAVCAGAIASIILCPIEETRIRLVTDPDFGQGLLDGLPRLIKEEGVLSPFKRGLAPMLTKQVPYTMGKQVSFDLFAGMLYSLLIGLSWMPQKEIALEVEVGAACLASIVACLLSQPGDVLLTATYKTSDDNETGFGSVIKKVLDEGGMPAFLSGLNARFLHVGCIITFQLVIYDQLKQGLGLPATGH